MPTLTSAALISCLLAGALLAAPVSATRPHGSRNDDPAPSCMSLKDEGSCMAAGCSWCSGSALGDGCLAVEVAKLVPAAIATCELPPAPSAARAATAPTPGPAPGGGCMAAKDEKNCLKNKDETGACAWCKDQWQGDTCVPEAQAKFMSGADCKFPKPSVDAAAAVAAAAAAVPKGPTPGPGPAPGGGCMSAKDKKTCLETKDFMGGCAWCKSQWQGESCVSETQAKFMPGADCKFPKPSVDAAAAVAAAAAVPKGPTPGPGPAPGGGCMSAKDKKTCLKTKDFMGGCAWCKSQWQGESCVSETQAKFMPGADCKFPKPSVDADDADAAAPVQAQEQPAQGGGDTPYGPGGGGGAGCMSAKDKHDCLKTKDFTGGCAWCKSQWQGESCVSEMQAKFIPGSDCTFPKGGDDDDDDDEGYENDEDDEDDEGYENDDDKQQPAGAGADAASGGAPEPGPPGGGGCSDAKDKRDCWDAKDVGGGGCAWCKSQWLPDWSCMSEQQAKYMPGNKCKDPKKKKAAAASEATLPATA